MGSRPEKRNISEEIRPKTRSVRLRYRLTEQGRKETLAHARRIDIAPDIARHNL